MRDYKKYNVWKKAHKLVIEVYQITTSIDQSEKYGLTGQVRRASSSVSINIVEGSGRKSEKEFIHFLYIAAASAAECEYLFQLFRELKLISTEKSNIMEKEYNILRRQIYKLIQSIK